MKLSTKLAQIFEEEVEKVIRAEESSPEYLPQEQFASCRERAEAGLRIAMKPVADYLTGAIAYHREKFHGEDRSEELAAVSKDTIGEVSVQSWWNQEPKDPII